MSRAISRESFNELKNYLGVYLQQGRVILDSDWNENQDINVAFGRRLRSEALGEGSPNKGFAIESLSPLTGLEQLFGYSLPFFLNFPGKLLDDFESADGWKLSSPLGSVRTSGDLPYEGDGFLRVSGHPGTVQLTRTLPAIVDLSAVDFVTFRYRVNQPGRGIIKFFIEDQNANRSVWQIQDPAIARDFWLAGCAGPLDLQLRILTGTLQPAHITQSYSGHITYVGGTQPVTASISAGALPPGLAFTVSPPGASGPGQVNFGNSPTTTGNFNFTVKLTDAAGKTAARSLNLSVTAPVQGEIFFITDSVERLPFITKSELPTGVPADVTRIQRYGFEVYQDPVNPLVWDFDSLRLAGNVLYDQLAANNFAIRGSALSQFRNLIILQSIFLAGFQNAAFNPVDFFSVLNSLPETSIENAGRIYVAGLPCMQIEDTLYSTQADPNDAPLTPPTGGVVRRDLVYLDVWQEAVTYVEDPELREVALGGPDTSTRSRTRSRVRVAQGGVLPVNATGKGTLTTEGSYTGAANRLYRIEIDTPGDINTAAFRWSEDNASTIQRIIQAVPPGSTRIMVEDASAFHPGDRILISKEFGSEEHVIASIFGNAVTLVSPTGAQLASLPGNGRTPNFTTFAAADHPKMQRWNAFRVPIKADPLDSMISGPISLNDGVQVRFGGRAMASGDYWSFRTRFLAGDELADFKPVTRIDRLRFQRPRGVVHYYAPLALLTRDGSDPNPAQISNIQDRRQRVGNTITTSGTLPNLTVTGNALVYAGGVTLPPAAADSRFLVYWSADFFMAAAAVVNSTFKVTAGLYSDAMKNPATDQTTGFVRSQNTDIPIARRSVNVDVPLTHLFVDKVDASILNLPSPTPTSVQFFVTLNSAAGFSIQLTNMQFAVIEMKKGF